jgi:hypothetical protein
MKDGHITLLDLDFEYKFWKNRLTLYIKEVEILRTRNEELISGKTGNELNDVELMVLDEHQEQLTKVLNRIKRQEEEIQFYNKDFPITQDHQCFNEHVALRKKMEFNSKVHFEKMADLLTELGI